MAITLPNDELLDAFVTALCDIERAEKRGDRECPAERKKYSELCSEVLVRLDRTEALFQPGDKVRVKPVEVKKQESYGGIEKLGLSAQELYTVDHCYYEGKDHWLVALENMRNESGIERLGYGAHLFEKAKIIKAA